MNKIEIYIKMIELVLPYIRCGQTQNEKIKGKDRSCYFEAELVHNLTKSILEGGLGEHDIWFLNHQAKDYFDNCNENISPNYNQHLAYIKELFSLVPGNLKSQLIWKEA